MTKQLWFVVACVISFVVLLAGCSGCSHRLARALPLVTIPQPARTLTAKEIFTLAAASSVRIAREGDEPGFGSGTIIYANEKAALILTCAHVVKGSKKVRVDVDTEGEDVRHYYGDVVKTDDKIDLALIGVAQQMYRPARPVAAREPELYDELYVVASPMTIMRQAAHEVLNTKDLGSHGHAMWSLSGEAIPGMSGGGVLNGAGELVCVVDATWNEDDQDYTQIMLAVPLATVRAFILK